MAKSENKTTALQVERHGWLLWVAAFAIIIASVATVFLLLLRLSREVTDGLNPDPLLEGGYYTGIAMAGMVCIFILYTIVKQNELRRLRTVLQAEESELESVRTRLSELSNMFQVATSLEIQLPVESILEILVRRVVAALKAQQASVMLYDPETQMLETEAFYGVEAEFASRAKQRIGEGIAGKVAELNCAVLLPQDEHRSDFESFYKPHRNITAAISVPLRFEDRCIGVLNVNRISHPEPFTPHQREILQIFAEHVGSVIQGAETMERLDQRAKGLELVNTQLSEMNRMKDVFLSTASHELKTPLTSIIGYAELLDEHAPTMAREQQLEFVRRLREEAGHLMGLIDDIMDLTRLETGKIELHQVPAQLNEIAHSAVETAYAVAKKKNVEIVEEFDPDLGLLPLDEVKIRQSLINLIVNAVKFSPEGGKVRIRTAHEPGGGLVEVIDQGPGVPPDEINRIFSLFGQSIKRAKEKQKGLGIGLHLVKRIVEIHGGDVNVDPAPDGGSIFWIRLPDRAPRVVDRAA